MSARAVLLAVGVVLVAATAFIVGRASVTQCGIAPDAGARARNHVSSVLTPGTTR